MSENEKTTTETKAKRGYTNHGYPASWRSRGKMSHEDCMTLMNEQIKLGVGKKFAVSKPKPKRVGPVAKKGYTSAGYPIVWKRFCTHDEALEHLKNGTSPKGKKLRVRCADTKDIVSIEKAEVSTDPSVFQLCGHDVSISANKYCYTLTLDGHQSFYGSYGGLLASLRARLIQVKVEKDNATITSLEQLVAHENAVSEALRTWTPGTGLDELLG